MIHEQARKVSSGYLMLAVLAAAQCGLGYLVFRALQAQTILGLIVAVLLSVIGAIGWVWLFMVHPNGKLKVNDSRGSPIEIAAVVVWKVYDTAEALFEVDDYEEFVQIQSESALRNLSTTYPYEPHEGEGTALRSHPAEIAQALREEIQDRLDQAGVTVIEARISHLAYASEIANAMLRRQQASAIIAARTQIVSGAVGMVEMALHELKNKGVVDLDEERKAAMVSNLLVVLCGEEATKPVVNTGTLYN